MDNIPPITPKMFLTHWVAKCSCGNTTMVIQSDWTYICEVCKKPWEATYTKTPITGDL